MMGSRGYRGAAECDAFSKRVRFWINWKPGEVRRLKRQFWKRQRRKARQLVVRESAH